MGSKKLWVTYAWADNEVQDVDFYISRLKSTGLDVHFDRRDLAAGRIIWEQLGDGISDPAKCDAWLGICSPAALASGPWREEMFYALNRALKKGVAFPMMFLVLGEKPQDLPAAMQIRLYVSTHQNDWLERIEAGARGVAPPLNVPDALPLKIRQYVWGDGRGFELTLREGTWPVWWVAENEPSAFITRVSAGVAGNPGAGGMFQTSGPHRLTDGRRVFKVSMPPISPIVSAYVFGKGPVPDLQLGCDGQNHAFIMPSAILEASQRFTPAY